MPNDLTDLRDSLAQSLDELLNERDAADSKGETAKVMVAQADAEAGRLGILLSNVQFAINNRLALNMDAVAERLQDSVEKQRAIGFSTAATVLEKIIRDISVVPPVPAPAPPFGPGDIQARPGPLQNSH